MHAKSAIFTFSVWLGPKVRRYCISTRGSWIHILVLANQIRPPDLLVLLSANQISATDHMTPFLQSDSSTWLVRLGGIIESGWGRGGRQLTRRCAEGWWTCVLPGGRMLKKSWRKSISTSKAYADGNVRLWQGGQGLSLWILSDGSKPPFEIIRWFNINL